MITYFIEDSKQNRKMTITIRLARDIAKLKKTRFEPGHLFEVWPANNQQGNKIKGRT